MLDEHQPTANVTLEPLDDFIVVEPLDESERAGRQDLLVPGSENRGS